jgi:hypothetical protein
MPPDRPAAAATSLQQMTMPVPPGGTGTESNPVGTLNAAGATPLPTGAYASPWYSDGPGCCGPLGRNGRIDYELYVHTGPTIPYGEAPFTDRLKTGWMIAGGGRTLFFNQPGDAAWIIDLGMSYQYNRGTFEEVGLFIRQAPVQNPITQELEIQPDIFVGTRIRALHRTAFNFALGRDWWLWGPGNVGFEQGWNLRVGADIGGRWGTCHVDLVPESQENVYARRQATFHGLFVTGHADIEAPFGSWIWFGGLRVQYAMDWTNVVIPINGNVQNVNFLMSTGFRF